MKRVNGDRKIPFHTKKEFYITSAKPVNLYGSKCWPALNQKDKNKIKATKTGMLKYMYRITRLNRNRKA